MINVDLYKQALNLIDLKNQEGFKAIFRTLTTSNQSELAAHLAARLLKKREAELFCPNPLRERYEFVLDNLKAEYPFLLTYFARMHPGNGLHCVAISSKGQRCLISQMSGNPKIKVCENYGYFENFFKEICRSAAAPLPATCILRHRSPSHTNTNHSTAIHITRLEGQIAVYFADSTGGPNTWTNLIVNSLKQSYQESGSTALLQIYFYQGKSRQVDHTNCVVYALKDAAYMAKNSLELMAFVKNQAPLQLVEDNVFGVPFLPLPMMKTMQSLRAINTYLEETALSQVMLPSKKCESGKTLKDVVAKHTFIACDDRGNRTARNGKVSQAFLKYERTIIQAAIKELR